MPRGSPGWIGWDYEPSPQAVTDDPVGWVREHARGLDPEMQLWFEVRAGDRDHVVVVARPDGAPIAFVDFGIDGSGGYYPLAGEACASSGIEDFAS